MSLADVRHGLERRLRAGVAPASRDPFAVHQGNALDALRLTWGDAYVVRVRGGMFEAASLRRPGNVLEAATPDELQQEIAADWGLS